MDIITDLGHGSKTVHGLSYESLDYLRRVADKNNGRAVIANTFVSPTEIGLNDLPSGIQFFSFDTVGRAVFPKPTPLVNRIPRSGPVGGTGIFYREITDININKTLPGVSEGNRGAVVDRSTRERVVRFSGLGYENINSFESMYAARGVANPRELARLDALIALKMMEERVLLYGNKDAALGTPAKPVGTDTVCATGETSTMTGRTIKGKVVALTGEGAYLASVANGVSTTFVRNNADGSTDTINGGSSALSPLSDAVVVTGGHKVVWTVTDIPQACAYAWYIGLSAGPYYLTAITPINVFEQFDDEGTTTQVSTAITGDHSANALNFNGVLTVAADTNTNGYYKSVDGAGLTADTSGNIFEFVEACYSMYTKFLFGPTEIMVHPLEAYNITTTLLSGPASSFYARQVQVNDQVPGGFFVPALLNPFTGDSVKITVHPYMPQGTILLFTDSIPYPIENLGSIHEVVQRQPYYVIDWPLRTRRNEVGIYVDETYKCELLFAQGVIKNVKSQLKAA